MVSSGAKGYLLKTESIEHLRDAILSIYRNGVYFSPSMPGTMYRRIINGEMKLPRLSRLERDVLYYSCSDLSYETIGEILGTSKRSIESARDRLFCKFAISSRVSLALLAVRLGYVPLENIPCRLI
jgi:DNA-binding NarL/FixJ family response regulator